MRSGTCAGACGSQGSNHPSESLGLLGLMRCLGNSQTAWLLLTPDAQQRVSQGDAGSSASTPHGRLNHGLGERTGSSAQHPTPSWHDNSGAARTACAYEGGPSASRGFDGALDAWERPESSAMGAWRDGDSGTAPKKNRRPRTWCSQCGVVREPRPAAALYGARRRRQARPEIRRNLRYMT